MIPDDALSLAWQRAAEELRGAGGRKLPTSFSVRYHLARAGVVASPGDVRRECARVSLRLFDPS